MTGRLEVICGPMFSGKTEELIRRLRRHQIAGRKVAAYKPSIDTRSARGLLSSHSGFQIPCSIIEDGVDLTVDVVGIDEIQLLPNSPVWAEFVRNLVNNNDKYVVVSGLDMTYRRQPFQPLPELLAVAESVTKLTAVCHKCGKEAYFTQRLRDGKPAPFSDETIVVGGLDTYEARCREHFEVG